MRPKCILAKFLQETTAGGGSRGFILHLLNQSDIHGFLGLGSKSGGYAKFLNVLTALTSNQRLFGSFSLSLHEPIIMEAPVT